MAKLTARKNARRPRTLSSKAKENQQQLESSAAQTRPRPKPRPTGKSTKFSQGSTVLSDTSNNDQEVQSVAEALVSMGSSTAGTYAPTAPIDWHRDYRLMSNITVSDLEDSNSEEDSDLDNDDEIDQLDSDTNSKEDHISNAGMSISILDSYVKVYLNHLVLPVESPTGFPRLNTTSTSIFEIPIEVPYKNAKRDVTGITSASSFAHVLRQIAERMDAGPSRMAAIGYIPSFLPKSPKPIPKLLEDDECWEKLIRDVREYIESFAVKRSGPPRRIKPFVINIVDTNASADNKATTV